MTTSTTLALDLATIDVTNPALVELAFERKELPGISPHNPVDVAVAGVRWLTSVMDPHTAREVANFRWSRHEALLVRGMPISTSIATPATGFLATDECVLDFDLLQFGMLRLMGIQPFAVDYENDGKLVRNVVPVDSAAGTTSSWGADVEFSWHTDNPNWPFAGDDGASTGMCAPTFLAFSAVRNIEQASTDVVSGNDVLSRLPNSVNLELRRAVYRFDPPASNESDPQFSRVLPLVEDSPLGPRIRFDDSAVSPTDEASAAALCELRTELAQTEGVPLILQTGDFFIFKNERVLHRRKAFTPRGNGQSRWLRRCYGN